MKRKLVEQGGGTLMVSLPMTWVKKFNLAKGDEIEVNESGKKLLFSTDKAISDEKAELDISGVLPMVKRAVGAMYKAGYDEVNIVFDSPQELKDAQFVIWNELTGFEIVDQGKNSLVAKSVSAMEHREFDQMLRRMFLFTLSMAEDGLESLKKGDFDEMESVALRDGNINKLADFCRRSINKNGVGNYKRPAPLYYIIEETEKIGDGFRDILRYCSEKKLKPKKEMVEFYSKIILFFRDFYQLFYNFKLEDFAKFGKKRILLENEAEKMLEQTSKKEVRILFYITTLISMIFDMNGPLMAANF